MKGMHTDICVQVCTFYVKKVGLDSGFSDFKAQPPSSLLYCPSLSGSGIIHI